MKLTILGEKKLKSFQISNNLTGHLSSHGSVLFLIDLFEGKSLTVKLWGIKKDHESLIQNLNQNCLVLRLCCHIQSRHKQLLLSTVNKCTLLIMADRD